MARYFLKVSDLSTAGGVVIEGIDQMTEQGVPFTFIGAQVSCPACQSIGHIIPTGTRLPQRFFGKEPALDQDLCQCLCDPLPVMIASQSNAGLA